MAFFSTECIFPCETQFWRTNASSCCLQIQRDLACGEAHAYKCSARKGKFSERIKSNCILFVEEHTLVRDCYRSQMYFTFPSFLWRISMDGVLKWVHSGPLPDASPQIKPGSIRMPPPYSRFQFGQIHFAAWTNTLCNLDKYLLPMPATLHQIKSGSINMPQYFLFLTNSPPLGFILSNRCVNILLCHEIVVRFILSLF